jgi:hypothetical protein
MVKWPWLKPLLIGAAGAVVATLLVLGVAHAIADHRMIHTNDANLATVVQYLQRNPIPAQSPTPAASPKP